MPAECRETNAGDEAHGDDISFSVIPGRSEATSPESITTIGSMDSGPAPRGASRNDEGCYFSFVKMIVPDAANMPPTPWHTEIFAFGTCAGAMPRICRTLSCSAYMPYMPECM